MQPRYLASLLGVYLLPDGSRTYTVMSAEEESPFKALHSTTLKLKEHLQEMREMFGENVVLFRIVDKPEDLWYDKTTTFVLATGYTDRSGPHVQRVGIYSDKQ